MKASSIVLYLMTELLLIINLTGNVTESSGVIYVVVEGNQLLIALSDEESAVFAVLFIFFINFMSLLINCYRGCLFSRYQYLKLNVSLLCKA